MKKIVVFVLITLLNVGILYAQEGSNKIYNMDDFIGSWKISESIQQEDALISFTSVDTYKKDGSLISKGDIKIFDINKTLIAHSKGKFIDEWSVTDNKLTEQIIECKFDEIMKAKDPMHYMLLKMILNEMCNKQVNVTQNITYVSEDLIIIELLNEKTELIRVKP